MAPDTELLKDIGIVVLGIILFVVLPSGLGYALISYGIITYGVLQSLFRINLDKTTEKKR